MNLQQSKILYHTCYETSSDWDIVQWNTIDTTNYPVVIKESVDDKGRVIELEFLSHGKYAGSLCYLANRVTYEYKEDTITETLYWGNRPLYATDCEVPYKRKYYLDKDYYITKVVSFALYNSDGLSQKDIANWKKWVPEYSVTDSNSDELFIEYYIYSFAKYNGIYPVSRNYVLSDECIYGCQPEKESIEKGIKLLRQNNR
jgi:hypothetical protein